MLPPKKTGEHGVTSGNQAGVTWSPAVSQAEPEEQAE
jgi:hypothetical protein